MATRKRNGKQLDALAPAPPQPPPEVRRSLTEVADAIEFCEQALTHCKMHPRRAARMARRPPPEGLGMSRTTANRFVAAALKRMHRDQVMEPIESKRARLIGMVQANAEQAMTLTKSYVNKRGDVITVPAPDLRAAGQALELLARLEKHL